MEFQEFKKKLHTVLQLKYLKDLQKNIDQEKDFDRKILKLVKALGRKNGDPKALREGFLNILGLIRKNLESKKDESFSEFYLSKVNDIASEFPLGVEWIQDEDRFKIADSDSILTSISKRGKIFIRSLSRIWNISKRTIAKPIGRSVEDWQPWKQTIPLQRVVKYYLLDAKLPLKLLHKTERIHQEVILELEQFLESYSRISDDEIDYPEFIESLELKTKAADDSWREILNEEVKELELKILGEIDKVGTIEKRASNYSEKQILNLQNESQQNLSKAEKQWHSTDKLFVERTQNLAKFLGLWDDIRDLERKFLNDLSEYFEKYFSHPFDRFYHLLEDSIEIIEKSGSSSSTQQIKQQKDQLSDYVREELIEPIQNLQDQQQFTRKAEHFSEDLLIVINQVPQTTSFIHDVRIDREPPEADSKEIEWRTLLAMAIREEILNEIQPSNQNYEDFLAEILRVLVEIDGVIEINFESALAAQKERQSVGGSIPNDVAGEALERLLSKVEDLRASCLNKFQDIEKTTLEAEQEFGRSILDLLRNGDANELQMFRAKFKVKEATKDWKIQFDAQIARAQDKLLLWYRFVGRKTRQYVSWIMKFLGYGDQQLAVSKRADIATYLSETDQKLKGLPYIYRRLFKFDEIADKRFYIPVPEASATLKKAYEQWKQGFPATFAVMGEKGSGKSTFLDLASNSEVIDDVPQKIRINSTIYTEQQLAELMSRELGLKGKTSIDQTISEIHKWDLKKVVTVDRIENCFVRNINGYEAIEKLCYLISETKEQIFWVVSCSRYTWRFLEKTISISEYFSHFIQTDTLDADQIEKVISRRHKASGYNLYFEPGEDDKNNRSYRKLQDQPARAQDYLKSRYFEKLTELAEGNVSIAMIFWIRSIRDFDNASFYIQPMEITSIEIIEDLNPLVLFTLAAFVLHDTISDTNLSMILNLTKEESRLMLIRLRSRGLLLQKGDYYSLNHLVYRQIVRGLKERNIIHLV